MTDGLRVGVAVFNAGDHRVAGEAWEGMWLSRDDGTADERLRRGLIRYATAIHRGRRGDWRDAAAAAGRAVGDLAGLDADTRGVNVGEVRAFLRRLAADPELVERRRPVALRLGGDAVGPTDLAFGNVATAARLLAAGYDAFEEEVVSDAVRYARAELDDGRGVGGADGADGAEDRPRRPQRRDPGFVGMLFDLAADRGRRSLVYDRLRAHVERRRNAERDASGLFE